MKIIEPSVELEELVDSLAIMEKILIPEEHL